MPVVISSIVRHLLTLAAGGLISYGAKEADTESLATALEPVITGVVLYAAGQAWSILDKKKKR
jgi:hypothetical protein